MIHDNWEDLIKADEDWEDAEDLIIVVNFPGSIKNYRFYTENDELKKGDQLKIERNGRSDDQVKIVGYDDNGKISENFEYMEIAMEIVEVIRPKKKGKDKKSKNKCSCDPISCELDCGEQCNCIGCDEGDHECTRCSGVSCADCTNCNTFGCSQNDNVNSLQVKPRKKGISKKSKNKCICDPSCEFDCRKCSCKDCDEEDKDDCTECSGGSCAECDTFGCTHHSRNTHKEHSNKKKGKREKKPDNCRCDTYTCDLDCATCGCNECEEGDDDCQEDDCHEECGNCNIFGCSHNEKLSKKKPKKKVKHCSTCNEDCDEFDCHEDECEEGGIPGTTDCNDCKKLSCSSNKNPNRGVPLYLSTSSDRSERKPKYESKDKLKGKEIMGSYSKTEQLVNNMTKAIKSAKDVAFEIQKGNAVLAAIRTPLLESGLITEKMKEMIEENETTSNAIVGVVLQGAAITFTDSEIIQKAAKSANFAGAVSFSNEFTLLQDLIETGIKNALKTVKPILSGEEKKEKKVIKKKS